MVSEIRGPAKPSWSSLCTTSSATSETPQNFCYELSVNKEQEGWTSYNYRLGKTRHHLGEWVLVNPWYQKLRNFPRVFWCSSDWASDVRGGVFITFKRDLLCTATPELDTNCEIVWCKMNINGCRTLYLGSFYRPPDKIDNDYLEEFNSSLSWIMSNRNAHVLVGGDFNCGDIEWSHMKVPRGVQKRQSQQQLLDIIGEHCLTQVVDIPTCNDKTLDLLFTNLPSPVNRVKGMPIIGKADRDIV